MQHRRDIPTLARPLVADLLLLLDSGGLLHLVRGEGRVGNVGDGLDLEREAGCHQPARDD